MYVHAYSPGWQIACLQHIEIQGVTLLGCFFVCLFVLFQLCIILQCGWWKTVNLAHEQNLLIGRGGGGAKIATLGSKMPKFGNKFFCSKM